MVRLKTTLGLAEAWNKTSVFASWLSSKVLRRSTMFVARHHQSSVLQRSAMFVDYPSYIPLVKERANQVRGGYKHFAPPEQEPPPQMKTIFCARLLVGIVTLSLLTGCNTRLPGQPNEAERWRAPSEIADFNQLYTQNCAGCHGVGGRLGAARSLNDPLYLAFVTDDALRQAISKGRTGTNMPAFSETAGGHLTDQQIELIVAGMRSTWSRPDDFKGVELPRYSVDGSSAATNNDTVTKAPQAGDASRGVATYKTFCSSCHGTNGDGGSAGSIVDPNFLNLVSEQGLRTTVVVGRADIGKPDWRGNVPGHPMSAEEINDVVAWLLARRRMTNVAANKGDHSACLNMK